MKGAGGAFLFNQFENRSPVWAFSKDALKALGIAIPALVVLILVCRAIFDENTSDIRYTLPVGLIFLASLLVKRRTAKIYSVKDWLLRLLVILIPVLLMVPMTVILFIFAKVDMAAFLFHLIFSIDGTPWEDILPFAFTSVFFWLIFCLVIYRLRGWLDAWPATYFAFGAMLLAINPLLNDLAFRKVAAHTNLNHSMLSYLSEPKIVENVQEKKNLILVYLEGLEANYLDNELFGTISPELNAIVDRSLKFENVYQVEATGWSLAGTIATQCGVPTLPFGAKQLDEMHEIARIMPGVSCLGDVLSELGYSMNYVASTKIMGNTMGFYGFDNFFGTHSYDRIVDRDVIVDRYNLPKFESLDSSSWGLYDSQLFDATFSLIKELDAQDQPFSISMATMDTHGPAVISPPCQTDGRDISERIEDSVACAGRLLSEFLDKLENTVNLDDYRIVIMSDHLAHHNNASERLKQKTRSNLVLLYDAADGERNLKEGSMLDVYPTILDWLEFLDGTKAGFGSSLLSEENTLVEEIGFDAVNSRFITDVQTAQFIWTEPKRTPAAVSE